MKQIEKRIERLEQRFPSEPLKRMSKLELAQRCMYVMLRPAYPDATDVHRQASDKLLAMFFPGVTADQLKSRMDDERRQRPTSGGSPRIDAPPQADQYAARNDAFVQYLNERSAPFSNVEQPVSALLSGRSQQNEDQSGDPA